MCGIFGQIGRIDTGSALATSQLIRHRGPDDEGFLVVGKWGARASFGPDTAATTRNSAVHSCREMLEPGQAQDGDYLLLGHRRLSIVELSPMGHQPMQRESRYWMVYNGEVYNYREIRAELEARGRTFVSDSDSEVIMAAYAEWGPACLDRFNGMWAIAIFDAIENSLFLARDRFGVKPLYLWPRAEGLAFASEIKAFTAFPDWKPVANHARVYDFLVWNVLDHSEETLFQGVVQLPAGHSLTLDLEMAGSIGAPPRVMPQPVRWYDVETAAARRGAGTVERIRDLLRDSVRLRLRADVPVGSCLSGGVDSSAIVSLMGGELEANRNADNLRTITARSSDASFDEGKYAKLVAENSGASPVEVVPSPEGLFDNLEKLIWHQDEPFVSTSIYAQWEVFRAAARENLTVMLDGQGADEVFGGYLGFFGAALAGLVRKGRFGGWVREVRAIRANAGFSYIRSVGYTLAYLMPRAVRLLGKLDSRSYSELDWVSPSLRRAGHNDPLAKLGARAGSVSAMSIAQVRSTNLPMLLRWEDRNSMAHSIEARVPFLDYRLVETAIATSDSDKVGGGVSKRILRDAMRGIVPDSILDRKDKMGFVTAEPLWMTRDMSARFRTELLSACQTLPSVLCGRIVDQFDEVVEGRRAFDFRYWRAIVLARWAQCFAVDFARQDRP